MNGQEGLDFLTQQKIELLLQLKTKKMDEDIRFLRETVGMLQQEVMSLRRQVQERPMQQAMPAMQDLPPVRQSQPQQSFAQSVQSQQMTMSGQSQAQPQAAPKQSGSERNQRMGDVKPEDVAISKFFNFSGKR